jgi:hypothetical protein
MDARKNLTFKKVVPFVAVLILVFLSSTAWPASPILFFGVSKEWRFVQTNSQPPVLRTSGMCRGEAFLFGEATASVRMPGGAVKTLVLKEDHFEFSEVFDAIYQLNNGWPSGGYTLDIGNSGDGAKHSLLQIASDGYPAPANVLNYDALQQISASQSFTISWAPLSRLTSELTTVRIEEKGIKIFETAPVPGAPGALDGTSLGVTIPANTLLEGRTYDCYIGVWRAAYRDTTTIPGTLGESAYISETGLTLKTRFQIQDVNAYSIEKVINYDQRTATAPELRPNPYEFRVTVLGSNSTSLTSCSVKAPNGSTYALLGPSPRYTFSQSFGSGASMDGVFANGNYEIILNTSNNGRQTNSLPLVGNTFPGTPQVMNIDASQFIVAAAPFTLSWSIPGALSSDLVHVAIGEGGQIVFSTGESQNLSGALNGSATSLAIPAGTLKAGHTYWGSIRCFRPVQADATTYPLCVGYTGYSKVTRFPLLAVEGTTPQPTISNLTRTNNQTVFSFSTVRGQRYSVQRAITGFTWSTLLGFTAPESVYTVMIPDAAGSNAFFRVVAGQ